MYKGWVWEGDGGYEKVRRFIIISYSHAGKENGLDIFHKRTCAKGDERWRGGMSV